MSQPFDLVVVSHLRWSFVWQRPQQLISRLARRHRVLFVEEPAPMASESRHRAAPLERVAENITVMSPRVRAPQSGAPVWDDQDSIAEQVRYAMQVLRFRSRALWFYTPLPDFLLHTVQPDLVVYDVMDELANFKFAPPNIRAQEARMLRRADVVFTGGASLFEAKMPYNENTHLFASGVDEKHYALACNPETEVPDYVYAIPAPRVVYIGVIDERLDYELLNSAALNRPDVQFVMVGPVVKVDPSALPKAANIHYLGQRDYADLPRILKGADACLMPFALNEATRFISPTKTLEYMAAHRPIVSTPVRDVERFYSDIVYLARTPDEFLRQLDAALSEHQVARLRREAREERILTEHGWDAIADNMDRLMEEAWNRNRQHATTVTSERAAPARAARPAVTAMGPAAIAAAPARQGAATAPAA